VSEGERERERERDRERERGIEYTLTSRPYDVASHRRRTYGKHLALPSDLGLQTECQPLQVGGVQQAISAQKDKVWFSFPSGCSQGPYVHRKAKSGMQHGT